MTRRKFMRKWNKTRNDSKIVFFFSFLFTFTRVHYRQWEKLKNGTNQNKNTKTNWTELKRKRRRWRWRKKKRTVKIGLLLETRLFNFWSCYQPIQFYLLLLFRCCYLHWVVFFLFISFCWTINEDISHENLRNWLQDTKNLPLHNSCSSSLFLA